VGGFILRFLVHQDRSVRPRSVMVIPTGLVVTRECVCTLISPAVGFAVLSQPAPAPTARSRSACSCQFRVLYLRSSGGGSREERDVYVLSHVKCAYIHMYRQTAPSCYDVRHPQPECSQPKYFLHTRLATKIEIKIGGEKSNKYHHHRRPPPPECNSDVISRTAYNSQLWLLEPALLRDVTTSSVSLFNHPRQISHGDVRVFLRISCKNKTKKRKTPNPPAKTP